MVGISIAPRSALRSVGWGVLAGACALALNTPQPAAAQPNGCGQILVYPAGSRISIDGELRSASDAGGCGLSTFPGDGPLGTEYGDVSGQHLLDVCGATFGTGTNLTSYDRSTTSFGWAIADSQAGASLLAQAHPASIATSIGILGGISQHARVNSGACGGGGLQPCMGGMSDISTTEQFRIEVPFDLASPSFVLIDADLAVIDTCKLNTEILHDAVGTFTVFRSNHIIAQSTLIPNSQGLSSVVASLSLPAGHGYLLVVEYDMNCLDEARADCLKLGAANTCARNDFFTVNASFSTTAP